MSTPISSDLTFGQLVELEPRLADLLEEARSYRRNHPRTDLLAAWYLVFKRKLVKLVGWFSEKEDKTLRSSSAYELAYVTVLEALTGHWYGRRPRSGYLSLKDSALVPA